MQWSITAAALNTIGPLDGPMSSCRKHQFQTTKCVAPRTKFDPYPSMISPLEALGKRLPDPVVPQIPGVQPIGPISPGQRPLSMTCRWAISIPCLLRQHKDWVPPLPLMLPTCLIQHGVQKFKSDHLPSLQAESVWASCKICRSTSLTA